MRVAVRPVKSDLQRLVECLESCRRGHGERAGYWRVGYPFWAEVEVEEIVLALAAFFVRGPVAALAGGGAVLRRFTSGARAEGRVCGGFGAGCAGLGGHCCCVLSKVCKSGW
jgi:hypothetical protein